MSNVNFENIQFGQLVKVLSEHGYHAGKKVHGFTPNGVYIGNTNEFVPYSNLEFRTSSKYERCFYGRTFESVRQAWYVLCCKLATFFIRKAERMSR